jgi:hypothetical protein
MMQLLMDLVYSTFLIGLIMTIVYIGLCLFLNFVYPKITK